MRVVFNDHADMAGPIYSAVRIWSHSAFARANTHEMFFLLGGMIGMMALVAFAASSALPPPATKRFCFTGSIW